MKQPSVFISVGVPATEQQERFVRAIEDRLRTENLTPLSLGRNTFTSRSPLKKIDEMMEDCVGVVVIALERTYFASGTERRGGPQETQLSDIKFPTPWNQIEAAMAYTRGLPLMVIVENGIRSEGLLDKGYDWHVQRVSLDLTALNSAEFNGVLSAWKANIQNKSESLRHVMSTSDLTIGELIRGLKPAHLWGIIVALTSLIGGAIALGAKVLCSCA